MAEKLFMTALSPTMEMGTITEWHKSEGDEIKNGDVLCEVETDKAVMEYEADFDAILLKILLPAGSSAEVGETIAVYGEAGEAVSVELSVESEIVPDSPPDIQVGDKHRMKSSPLARRMAESSGIDISVIAGSGTAGRIVKRDIEAALAGSSAPLQSSNAKRADGHAAASSGMRAVIAARLSASKFSAPHYYLSLTADMSAVFEARKNAASSGRKISINSYLMKFIAGAFKKHPIVNSTWNNGDIREFASADIGFAVALKNGLITPVVRNVEDKGIIQINEEFRELAERALSGKLTPDEYSNASFTISNLGSFGIEEFTAIINPPGSAILAVGAVIKKQIVITDDNGNDSVEIRPMMKMTLSCDHRVIDGAVGAAYLSDLKKIIENPVEALM